MLAAYPQRLHIFDKRSVEMDNFMHAGDPIASSLLGRPVPQLAHCLPAGRLFVSLWARSR